MNIEITERDLATLRRFIEDECGLVLSEEKNYLVENRLIGLVAELKCRDFGQLHRKASGPDGHEVRDRIIDAVTTHETWWFRDGYPFDVLGEELFPALLKQMDEGVRNCVRVWSAAASTGQEAYSVAITYLETLEKMFIPAEKKRDMRGKLKVVASDVSSSALLLARSARYGTLAMSRGMPRRLQDKYFSEEGRVHVLDKKVRELVDIRKFNLLDDFSEFGRFDIIFLRNAVIYFAESFRRELFERIACSLKPGGYLFTGTVEMVTNYSDRFELRRRGNGVYYVLK